MAFRMKWRRGALVLLLAGAFWLVAGGVPRHRHMTADFHALQLTGSAAVNSVKLVDSNGVAFLYSTGAGPEGSELSLARFQAGSARVEQLGPLSGLPEQPTWDAAPAEDGSFSVVITQAGSAVSALAIRNTRGGATSKVNRHDGFGVFGAPRFVKGGSGEISSVALVNGKTRLVLFPKEADGGFGKYRNIDAQIEGVMQDALLLRSASGYLLLAKVMSLGSGQSARRDPGGKVTYPGVLVYAPLDDNFKASELSSRPLGGQLILGFDACLSGDGVAVFAVTPNGYTLAAGKLTNGVFPPGSWAGEKSERPLGSPSILPVGSKLYLAALESPGSPDQRIVVARVP